jgi:MYXO-CTERM domain-containing protein
VQAGERILFAVENGQVTAHIQIQYAGDAKDFGWLLPLPSIPTLKVGTEELFAQLIRTTQPRYFVTVKSNGNCGPLFGAAGPFPASSAADGVNREGSGGGSPLVIQSSIGPYDYAVLKADKKDEMLKWLSDNRYFIPVGTEDVVGPYIRPGAFFLALKLKSGKSAGDIQPVVLNYPSDLPMIPIILTSVAAQPNMGIQVWMLGDGRAIPRNYRHVVLNDSQIDWLNQARNYNDVVIRAVSEAPEKHAFVTEYAGTSNIMRDVLDAPARFGDKDELGRQATPGQFVDYLFSKNYAATPAGGFRAPIRVLPPYVKSVILASIPLPPALAVSEDDFLDRLDFYLGDYRAQNPGLFMGYTYKFDGPAMAAELFEKVVKPAREAGALFKKYPTLTRLYTTLSPQDMTRDPVFSFNRTLPEVTRDHTATYEVFCGLSGDTFSSPGRLITEQGWTIGFPKGRNQPAENDFSRLPNALRIETLAEEGAAIIDLDNTPSIRKFAPSGCGCATVDPLLLTLGGLLVLGLRRRRT